MTRQDLLYGENVIKRIDTLVELKRIVTYEQFPTIIGDKKEISFFDIGKEASDDIKDAIREAIDKNIERLDKEFASIGTKNI